MTTICTCKYLIYAGLLPLEHEGRFFCGACGYVCEGRRAKEAKLTWDHAAGVNARIMRIYQQPVPRRKARSTSRAKKEESDRDYTLAEWLTKRRISQAQFTKMQKNHRLAIAVIQQTPGGKIRITREADEAWVRRMQSRGERGGA